MPRGRSADASNRRRSRLRLLCRRVLAGDCRGQIVLAVNRRRRTADVGCRRSDPVATLDSALDATSVALDHRHCAGVECGAAVCIVGWASPLVSAGILFPNTAWLGLAATLALPGFLLNKSTRGTALFTAVATSLVLNFRAKPLDTPKGWEPETTRIHRGRTSNALAEFSIEQYLQRVAVSSKGTVLVFPEGAVRRWTDITDDFWSSALADSGKTVLIGAAQPIAGSSRNNNSVVVVGGHPQAAVHQRVPVPGGMWNPLAREGGFALNLASPGTVDVGGERAAVLICYEQLLTWPILRPSIERQTLLIAVSNEAWTGRTVVPSIQHACVRAWARLFGLPLLSGINS